MRCGICGLKMQGSRNNGKPHYRCTFLSEYAAKNKIDHPASVYVREEQLLPEIDSWLARGLDPAVFTSAVARLNKRPDIRRRMTEEEIASFVTDIGTVMHTLNEAEPADKAEVYSRLGLTLTYYPNDKRVAAEARPATIMYVGACPRGDLNPGTGEISLHLDLNSKTGVKSPDRGVHAANRTPDGHVVARLQDALALCPRVTAARQESLFVRLPEGDAREIRRSGRSGGDRRRIRWPPITVSSVQRVSHTAGHTHGL